MEMPSDEARSDNDELAKLLERSDVLDQTMLVAAGFGEYRLYDNAPRTLLSFAATGVALDTDVRCAR